MTETLECSRCNIGWRSLSPPAVCPNCGGPWGEQPLLEHREVACTQHGAGYVAWCSCGVGSPAKTSAESARQSLDRHMLAGRQ